MSFKNRTILHNEEKREICIRIVIHENSRVMYLSEPTKTFLKNFFVVSEYETNKLKLLLIRIKIVMQTHLLSKIVVVQMMTRLIN